ncbi:hypothetical protein J7L67_03230 [bacterium]|nr:hypothetical protein [bacterium]
MKHSNNSSNKESEEYIGSVHSETMKRILAQWHTSKNLEISKKISWLSQQQKKK